MSSARTIWKTGGQNGKGGLRESVWNLNSPMFMHARSDWTHSERRVRRESPYKNSSSSSTKSGISAKICAGAAGTATAAGADAGAAGNATAAGAGAAVAGAGAGAGATGACAPDELAALA